MRWAVLRLKVEADRRRVQQSCGCVTEASEAHRIEAFTTSETCMSEVEVPQRGRNMRSPKCSVPGRALGQTNLQHGYVVFPNSALALGPVPVMPPGVVSIGFLSELHGLTAAEFSASLAGAPRTSLAEGT